MVNDELSEVLGAVPPDPKLRELIGEVNELRKARYELVVGKGGFVEMHEDPRDMGTMELESKIEGFKAELKKLGIRGVFSEEARTLKEKIDLYSNILKEKNSTLNEISAKEDKLLNDISERLKIHPNSIKKLAELGPNPLAKLILDGYNKYVKMEKKPGPGEALAH